MSALAAETQDVFLICLPRLRVGEKVARLRCPTSVRSVLDLLEHLMLEKLDRLKGLMTSDLQVFFEGKLLDDDEDLPASSRLQPLTVTKLAMDAGEEVPMSSLSPLQPLTVTKLAMDAGEEVPMSSLSPLQPSASSSSAFPSAAASSSAAAASSSSREKRKRTPEAVFPRSLPTASAILKRRDWKNPNSVQAVAVTHCKSYNEELETTVRKDYRTWFESQVTALEDDAHLELDNEALIKLGRDVREKRASSRAATLLKEIKPLLDEYTFGVEVRSQVEAACTEMLVNHYNRMRSEASICLSLGLRSHAKLCAHGHGSLVTVPKGVTCTCAEGVCQLMKSSVPLPKGKRAKLSPSSPCTSSDVLMSDASPVSSPFTSSTSALSDSSSSSSLSSSSPPPSSPSASSSPSPSSSSSSSSSSSAPSAVRASSSSSSSSSSSTPSAVRGSSSSSAHRALFQGFAPLDAQGVARALSSRASASASSSRSSENKSGAKFCGTSVVTDDEVERELQVQSAVTEPSGVSHASKQLFSKFSLGPLIRLVKFMGANNIGVLQEDRALLPHLSKKKLLFFHFVVRESLHGISVNCISRRMIASVVFTLAASDIGAETKDGLIALRRVDASLPESRDSFWMILKKFLTPKPKQAKKRRSGKEEKKDEEDEDDIKQRDYVSPAALTNIPTLFLEAAKKIVAVDGQGQDQLNRESSPLLSDVGQRMRLDPASTLAGHQLAWIAMLSSLHTKEQAASLGNPLWVPLVALLDHAIGDLRADGASAPSPARPRLLSFFPRLSSASDQDNAVLNRLHPSQW